MFDYVRQSNEIVFTEKFFESSITELIIMKASSVSLHPRMFLTRLSGEHVVFTEIYKGRNETGMISLYSVVIKNKQMEYIEQNGTKWNKIEPNRRIKFD